MGIAQLLRLGNKKFDSKDSGYCYHLFLLHVTFLVALYFYYSNHWKSSFTEI